jgi:hypothetical protein
MIQNPEQYLTTAGGKIHCRRCKTRSSRTKLQCSKPSLKGKVVCGHHDEYSTGPISKEDKDRIRAAHLKHGKETLETKAERNAKSVMIQYLTDIRNHYEIFHKEIGTRGQPPLGNSQLDLTDPEQLALAILKTLPRQ